MSLFNKSQGAIGVAESSASGDYTIKTAVYPPPPVGAQTLSTRASITVDKANNGFVLTSGGQMWVAKTAEELCDVFLACIVTQRLDR